MNKNNCHRIRTKNVHYGKNKQKNNFIPIQSDLDITYLAGTAKGTLYQIINSGGFNIWAKNGVRCIKSYCI
jgi:hypothetical protein